jgi:hypothetical protein
MQRVDLTEDNDLPQGGPRLVGGLRSAVVALQTVYSVQTGTWPYNYLFGTRWRGPILRKYFDPTTTREALAVASRQVPDIVPVNSNQITLDTITMAEFRQVEIGILGITDGIAMTDVNISTVI